MDTPNEGSEEVLKQLFARAKIKVKEAGSTGYPAVNNAFGGVLHQRGCTVLASRDFEWDTLAALAAAIRHDNETLIIFPERFMGIMGDQSSRWVLNGHSAYQATRTEVLRHAACVVRRHAVVFIEWYPSGEGALVLPRSAAEMVIYGNHKP